MDAIYNNTADIEFHNSDDIWWARNIPELTSQAITEIDGNSMVGNGTITELGGENSTERGFCYIQSTVGDPTILDNYVSDSGSFSLESFSHLINLLTSGKNYRVRAFARNSAGVGYGNIVGAITDLVLNETILFTDLLTKAISISKSETIQITDSLLKTPVITLQDSVIINDSLKKEVDAVFQDSITIEDVLKKESNILIRDSVEFTDQLAKTVVKNLREQVAFSDSILKSIELTLNDNVVFTDQLAKGIYIVLSDQVTFYDTIVKQAEKVLADTIDIWDLTALSLAAVFKDILLAAERIRSILALIKVREIASEEKVREVVVEKVEDSIITSAIIKQVIDEAKIKQQLNSLVKEILMCIKCKEIDSERKIKEISCENKVKEALCDIPIRTVMCLPIYLQKEEIMLAFSAKQSYEEYFVAFNFARVITSGTTISSATVIVYDAVGAVVTSTLTDVDKQSISGTKIFVWVRGGSEQTYKITCRIVMSNSEKFEQDAELPVTEV